MAGSERHPGALAQVPHLPGGLCGNGNGSRTFPNKCDTLAVAARTALCDITFRSSCTTRARLHHTAIHNERNSAIKTSEHSHRDFWIAMLTRTPDAAFTELHALYKDNDRLRVRASVFNALLNRSETI